MPNSLFDVTPKVETGLLAGIITDSLQQEFADNGIMLSANASIVQIPTTTPTWQISNEGEFYSIREQPVGFSVYMIPCCICKKSVDTSSHNTTYYAVFGGTVIYCPPCFLANI